MKAIAEKASGAHLAFAKPGSAHPRYQRLRVWTLCSIASLASLTSPRMSHGEVVGELIAKFDIQTSGNAHYSASDANGSVEMQESYSTTLTGETHYMVNLEDGVLRSGDQTSANSSGSVNGGGTSLVQMKGVPANSGSWEFYLSEGFDPTQSA